MPLKIRLSRGGAKKRPYYRIVIADARSPRDGRFIDRVGSWNPLLPKDHEDRIKIDLVKADAWIKKGAQPTDRVARFMSQVLVCDTTAAEAAEAERARLREAGREEAAAAVADPADPDAKVVRIAGDGEKGARPLFGWKAGNNPKKAEPGEKAKQRIEERREKEEAKKAAEEEAKAEAAPSDDGGGEEAAAEA